MPALKSVWKTPAWAGCGMRLIAIPAMAQPRNRDARDFGVRIWVGLLSFHFHLGLFSHQLKPQPRLTSTRNESGVMHTNPPHPEQRNVHPGLENPRGNS